MHAMEDFQQLLGLVQGMQQGGQPRAAQAEDGAGWQVPAWITRNARAFGVMMGEVVEGAGHALQQLQEENRRNNRDRIRRLEETIAALRTQHIQALHRRDDIEAQRLDRQIRALEDELRGFQRSGADIAVQQFEEFGQLSRDILRDQANAGARLREAAVRAHQEQHGANQRYLATLQYIRQPRTLMLFSGAIVATFAGIYGAKEMSKVLAEYVGARLGQPQLVRESSRETLLSSWWHTVVNKPESNGILDVVLRPEKEALLMEIADSTKEAHANGDPLMNVLFYGPPGTGKTMFAKALAEYSECDYAILSGADFSQFKPGDDITQLHSFFEWAKTSRRPLVVFVDEAETFLASRSNPNVSERSKKLTDAFLSQVTGQASDNIMFVFATNMPNLLDRAVMDRVGEKVEFPLPGHDERKRIFELHLKKFAERREIPVEEDVLEHLNEFSEQMDGFSGRTIAGVVLKSLRMMRTSRSTAISTTAILETIEREKASQADTAMASYI